MTKLLEQALEVVRRLPPDDQNNIARAMMTLAEGNTAAAEAIDPAHLPDILDSLAQARRREFASDEEVAAAFRRFEG